MERLLRSLAIVFLVTATVAIAGCGRDVVPETEAYATEPTGPTGIEIRPVPSVPTLAAGAPDANGHQVRVACSACHSMKKPDRTQRGGKPLATFHQGTHVAHGSLTCLSCHNEQDYDTLRLADSRSVAFENVMELCAQCHGPQARNYAHDAHGGMSGYWDTTRGVQTRNQCTHCHAPHAPAFPAMRPTFKPRDRFLSPVQESHR
ncbi:MAG: hypothetical protein HN940_05820 [Planctomycetes bacterium]|jgi:hypothetical protein|nr:hypothetical protein [Planctomycetota bacterium]MBT6969321.1 hypothetical protein [Planctomycetota bacterium]MBT7103805.1 hypothetical protein [Planctomycetota bacterium]